MKNVIILLILAIFSVSCSKKTESAKEITVLSTRGTHLIKPLFDEFTKETGINVKVSNNKAGVFLSLLKKGNTEADLLVTTDLGSLVKAESEGFLQATNFEVPTGYPAAYYSPEKSWFGLSRRTRVIFYNPEKIKEQKIDLTKVAYQNLGDQTKGKSLCLRTSKKVYNQALAADLVDRFGEEKTTEILKKWVSQLAAPVFASDREVIKAVSKGKCIYGIANSYYLGKMDEKVENVEILWSENSPAHVNLSGIGLLKDAPNKEKAEKLISWLMSDKAQKIFASVNYEYPVREDIEAHELLKKFGKPIVKAPTYFKSYENLHSQAIQAIDKAGYN